MIVNYLAAFAMRWPSCRVERSQTSLQADRFWKRSHRAAQRFRFPANRFPMFSFLQRRLAQTLITLLGVSLLSFLVADLAPGQYFQQMRLNPQISPQTLAGLRHEYGMDQPLALRYVRWLQSAVRGEFGFSFAYNTPVSTLLWPRLRNTLILTTTSLLVSWLIAIVVGVWSGTRRRRWDDRLLGVGVTLLVGTPDALIALLLLAFAVRTRWLPSGGMHSPSPVPMGFLGSTRDALLHLVLPATALAAATVPMLVRHVRSAVSEVWNSYYIVAGRGYGIPRHRLLLRHALPAAANPLISLFGVSVGMLVGGSLLVEMIMSWPGVGPLLMQSILERDPYVVIAAVLVSTLLLMIGNLVGDIALYVVDPRIRQQRTEL
jgi:peptide/nickel transport system permease protein